jgi:hypothetical protein
MLIEEILNSISINLTGSGTHAASCTMGTGSFPGVRAAEA